MVYGLYRGALKCKIKCKNSETMKKPTFVRLPGPREAGAVKRLKPLFFQRLTLKVNLVTHIT